MTREAGQPYQFWPYFLSLFDTYEEALDAAESVDLAQFCIVKVHTS